MCGLALSQVQKVPNDFILENFKMFVLLLGRYYHCLPKGWGVIEVAEGKFLSF